MSTQEKKPSCSACCRPAVWGVRGPEEATGTVRTACRACLDAVCEGVATLWPEMTVWRL